MAAMQHSSKVVSQPPKSPDDLGKTRSIASRVLRHSARTLHDQSCLQALDPGTRIVAANAGDHPLILQLLVQAHQCPLSEDFQSRLDLPGYNPSDRLLLQRNRQLIGHAHLFRQIGWFQGQRYSLAKLQDFFVLPEYRVTGYDEVLLNDSESVATDEGLAIAFMRTDQPEWFEQRGWSCCHGQGFSRANTRAILAHLDINFTKPRRRHSIEVRSWRHFEIDSLRHVYSQLSTNKWGMLHRSEEMWQWLVGRKAHDQILIAVKKDKRKTGECETEPNLVGYAIIRDSCIVEMLTLPGHSSARGMLVARACRDAIDRDHHFVSLYTPAADPMHELLITAGGSWVSDGAAAGGKSMLKLLSPHRWVERLYPILHERAREADISLPVQIDFLVDGARLRLTVTRRSARLESSTAPLPQVECDWHTFQNLLTSNLTYRDVHKASQLHVLQDDLKPRLAALFPAKLFWQSPFSILRL